MLHGSGYKVTARRRSGAHCCKVLDDPCFKSKHRSHAKRSAHHGFGGAEPASPAQLLKTVNGEDAQRTTGNNRRALSHVTRRATCASNSSRLKGTKASSKSHSARVYYRDGNRSSLGRRKPGIVRA